MSGRVLAVAALLCLIGCEVEEKEMIIAPKEKPRTESVTLAGAKGDFAQGTLKGVQLLPDGSLALRRKNLLANSSFEWDTYEGRYLQDGFAADWGMWGKGYGVYSDRSIPYLPNEATNGSRSQRIEIKAEGRNTLSLVQAVRDFAPGLPFTFSADVKVDAPTQMEAVLAIQFYTDGKWLADQKSDPASPTQFTRLSVSAVGAREANSVRAVVIFQPKVDNAVATVWVDSAQLEQSDKPTAYSPRYCPEPGEFTSVAMDLSATGSPYKFSWIACQPSGADLRFQIRSADTREALDSAPWRGPADADAYATRIESGPNLLDNPSLEKDSDGDNTPDTARTIGYGENDRAFSVVPDAHDGAKALKVEIKSFKEGNGRWEVWKDGPFEKDTEYVFSLWHKENAPTTPVGMSVAIQDAKGEMQWGRFGESRESSTAWKRDSLYFRTPKDTEIKRLYFELNLSGAGWAITDGYALHRVVGSEEWAVNPAHRGAKWLQWRALLGTSDPYYSAKLYHTELACGASVPEVRWLNVLSEDGQSQKYSFCPGQTALFKPQVIDYAGSKSIERVSLKLLDPSGRVAAEMPMARGAEISAEEAEYTARHRFADDAPQGEWQAVVEAADREGGSCREMVVLKVRTPYTSPPKGMVVGALASDYGFRNYKGENLKKLIEKYQSCKGLEIWKLAVAWQRLEPAPFEMDPEVIDGFREFIAAAHAAGAKAQITIQQQCFPDWVNNGDWDNGNRYRYPQTKRLANTWTRLADALKRCEGLESYLLINEENAVRDADVYLRAMSKVQAAVRRVDPDRRHRITLRPNTQEPFIRTRIATNGAQDYDYGSGGYPTSSSWFYKQYANPVSQTSCLRMARFHASPIAYGGPGGIGEIGYFIRPPKDTFGDEERLKAFERAMQIAYEMGMDEFMAWEGTFSFDKPDVFYPRLIAYRDEMLKKPRPEGFDVEVVIDTGDPMFVQSPPSASRLDMDKQPFAPAFRFLDGKGYAWFYTTPEAMAIQTVKARAVVRFSDLKGKGAAEQERFLEETLKGIPPSGTPLPWPSNPD